MRIESNTASAAGLGGTAPSQRAGTGGLGAQNGRRATASAWGAAVSVMRSAFSRLGSQRARQAELISSLSDVASAVSSTISLDDVLVTIVDRAKRVTDTDKTILMLTEPDSEDLDLDTLVVRGRRDQHLQTWWEERVLREASMAFANGVTMVQAEHEHEAWVVYAPIKTQDHAIGLLCAINSQERRFTHEQLDFLAILSAFAATAIENSRLAEETRYVLLSSERDRIAREMHDGVSQSLFSISLGLELAKKQVKREPDLVHGRLGELQEQLAVAMTELRRCVYDLRPMRLQELGLPGAIDFWIKEVTAGRALEGDLHVTGDEYSLGVAREQCLYRVAKESVSNVARHSGATSFSVRLEYQKDAVTLTIQDDGHGFPVDDALDGLTEGSGMGLRSIRERVERERGTTQITSSEEEGTLVTVRLPVGVEA